VTARIEAEEEAARFKTKDEDEESARIEAEEKAARFKSKAEAEETARFEAEEKAARVKAEADEDEAAKARIEAETEVARINIDKSSHTNTKASLMKLRVFELKKMCDACNICTKGLRKADLIDAYLDSKNQNEDDESNLMPDKEIMIFSLLKLDELRLICEERCIVWAGLKKSSLVAMLEDTVMKLPYECQSAKTDNVGKELIYSSMKITELREECEKKGIDIKGLRKKVDIIGRLESHAAGESEYSQVGKNKGTTKSAARFHALKVVELRAECEARELCSSGLKAILIQRLLDHY